MTVSERLSAVADQLGYRDASGFVDGSGVEPRGVDYVWQDLAQKCNVDAAYFRNAVPLVAFVDVESPTELRDTHRRLWNLGRVPVLIASTPDGTQVVDCNAVPHHGNPPVLASSTHAQPQSLLNSFSRFALEHGQVQGSMGGTRNRGRVDRHLLENLKRLRLALLRTSMRPEDIEPVLGRSIFIRYLEDRDILAADHMTELGEFDSFIDTLRQGRQPTLELFASLAEHFNGDVFSMRNAPQLDNHATDLLAEFFEGTELHSGQGSLWKYDFGIVPSQLISSIYEQLLIDTQRKDAAHYTPRRVVDVVLDEVLPWDATTSTPGRILDPACGSGIFLAEAFRRLAYMRATEQGGRARYEDLRDLLTSTIFGTDVNPAAIGVSAFSLYLALLERVDPPTIWRSVRLPDLVGSNLITADFFEDHALSRLRFDTIVGNPPWISKLSPAAREYVSIKNRPVADNQLANAFVWRASDLLEPDGYLGMVLPSKWLLHNRQPTVLNARRELWDELDLQVVVDLSPLRKSTFTSGRNPGAIAIARKHGAHEVSEVIVHVAPRLTPLANSVDGLVVSQQNIQTVAKSAADNPLTWKAILWGTAADLSVVNDWRQRYSSLDTVIEARGWTSGTGYQKGGGRHEDASHMFGLPIVLAENVDSPRAKVPADAEVFDIPTLHFRRNPELYRGPRLLMRKGFDRYPRISFIDEDAVFTDSLYAVVGRESDALHLKAIAGVMNSTIARYWWFMTSSSWGVEREQLFTHEFDSMPMPTLRGDVVPALAAVVDGAGTKYRREPDWLAALDRIVFELFDLSLAERDLVEDFRIRHSELSDGPRAAAYAPPTTEQLDAYGDRLEGYLNTVGRTRWSARVEQRLLGYTVVRCRAALDDSHEESTNRDDSSQFELRSLLSGSGEQASANSSTVILQPSLIWVNDVNVYLVKPDELRSWLPSNGTADAAEVLGAIVSANSADHRR